MSIKDKIKDNIMYFKIGLEVANQVKTIKGPIFIKDFSKENKQLSELTELHNTIRNEKKRDLIARDISFLKKGIEGEENVYYELKNSFIPMLCLHDIRIEFDDYVAQLDFIIITNKFTYVLETKKLSGDVEINSDGDFTRIIKNKYGKVIKKEGMYSPISQNERHIKILKHLMQKNNFMGHYNIRSAVIMANPKSILDKEKCPKEIENNIFKYDQISALLKREMEDINNDKDILERISYNLANLLLENNKPIDIDYRAKYGFKDEDMAIERPTLDMGVKKDEDSGATPIYGSVQDALKDFRLKTSRSENIKPYMVFNNDEMEQLIKINPKSKEQLLKVPGFGPKKVEKYGEKLLEILKLYN